MISEKIEEWKLEKTSEEMTFELRLEEKDPAVLKVWRNFREREIALHG